ncbi:ATPase family associated with various cellular activities (AAA) [Candidatus Magnetomoraceae bacterium gMMP-1]
MNISRYRGDRMPLNGDPDNLFPYLADKEVVEIVNMAIVLQRPLLLKGPPGCGKTTLADSIAHELSLPLYKWHIKSTSYAKDGLYTIDEIRRLQDVKMGKEKAQKLTPYIKFGPLGKAFQSDIESVVLIDEIDKADVNFPNDLLLELDEKQFTINELDEHDLVDMYGMKVFKKTFHARYSPIIIITSNDEKELPEAFLRRCLFHYVDFPVKQNLIDIVHINTTDLNIDKTLVELAVDRLNDIRSAGEFIKDPATCELIDWVCVLHYWDIEPKLLEQDKKIKDLPFWQILFKHEEDWKRLMRYAENEPTLRN